MKQKRNLTIGIIFSVLILLVPGFVLAADLDFIPDSLQFNVPSDQIPLNQEVIITSKVENKGKENVKADIVFLLNEQEIALLPISVIAGDTLEVSFPWLTPKEEGVSSLALQLSNQLPEATGESSRIELESISFVQNTDTPQPRVGIAPIKSESVVQIDQITPEPLSKQLPELSLHQERLSWNTFRLRPSYRLGGVEYSYEWDFGDGERSNERVEEHTFKKPGSYIVNLRLIEPNGEIQGAATQVHIGFFNLANWRLWLFVLLLAMIIIIASLIAGTTRGEQYSRQVKKKKEHPKKKVIQSDFDVDFTLDSLADDSGDFDSLAGLGMDTDHLAKELSFLEELDHLRKPKSSSKRVTKKKKPAKKKAVKKKTAKKKASKKTKVKKNSTKPKKSTKKS